MKKAVIISHSKTGRTWAYAEEIEEYLQSKEIETKLVSLGGYKDAVLNEADYLFLGCWTHGLMVVLQHPDKEWKEFAGKLPNNIKAKTALFTTYKILTGSMFGRMRKALKGKVNSSSTILKSRKTELSDNDKLLIENFLNQKQMIRKLLE